MRSVVDQIRWVQNPLQGLPGAVAQGRQADLQEEKFEEQKRIQALKEQQFEEQEKIRETQMKQGRTFRSLKMMDKALELAEVSYNGDTGDPSGVAAGKIIDGYKQELTKENLYEQEVVSPFMDIQTAPVGWSAPEGEEQSPNILTKEQIVARRKQLHIALEGLGMPTNAEETQARKKQALELQKQGLDINKLNVETARKRTQLSEENIDLMDKYHAIEVDVLSNVQSLLPELEAVAESGKEITTKHLKPFSIELMKLAKAGITDGDGLKKRIAQISEAMKTPAGRAALKKDLGKQQALLMDGEAYTKDMLGAMLLAAEGEDNPGIANGVGQWYLLPEAKREEYKLAYQAKVTAQKQEDEISSMKIRKAGQPIIQNVMGATQATKTKAMETARKALDQLASVQNLEGLMQGEDMDKFFGYAPTIKKWLGTAADNLGMLPDEYKPAYSKLVEIRSTVRNINLDKVHEFFGGALTFSEIKRSKGGIIDETMGPTELQAHMKRMTESSRRALAISETMLNVDFAQGSVEWRDEFDKRYLASTIEELRAGGADDRQVKLELGRRYLWAAFTKHREELGFGESAAKKSGAKETGKVGKADKKTLMRKLKALTQRFRAAKTKEDRAKIRAEATPLEAQLRQLGD